MFCHRWTMFKLVDLWRYRLPQIARNPGYSKQGQEILGNHAGVSFSSDLSKTTWRESIRGSHNMQLLLPINRRRPSRCSNAKRVSEMRQVLNVHPVDFLQRPEFWTYSQTHTHVLVCMHKLCAYNRTMQHQIHTDALVCVRLARIRDRDNKVA